ncbi:hypothetical protein FG93_01930 [Bosea sp. LC85]|uniref:hypothetical protein n=1 Tax=Bosea sp. LC85 TaxID=1502851 RepID=UPI0004E30F39|nr:hypothetical protein [Bosea sp. LC85]KFC73186.1 hypothetical protein FG93_01930 [Bosea sp. LC85]
MRFFRLLAAACLVVATALPLLPARAAQGSACMPTTGTVSGLAFAQAVNAGFAAVISSNSGAIAPATDCTGVAVKGQWWLDTSASPHIVKFYDGASWLEVGAVDLTNHVWSPPVGGGTASLASAATVDLGSTAGSTITITGSTAITSLGANAVAGTAKFVRFAGALTLTNNATSLILPGGVNITTAAGDQAVAIALGSGNWSIWSYSRATGLPIANQAVPVGTVLDYVGWTPPDDNYLFPFGQCVVRASYPALQSILGLTQAGTRVSGNATITGLADTSAFGAGMWVEGSGIQTGSTVVSLTSSSITLSLTATTSGTSDVTVYAGAPCGSASDIRLPDLRGRVVAGRDNMGGTAAGRLTAATVNGSPLGAAGGAETGTLTIAQLPTVTPAGSISASVSGSVTISDPGHTHGVNASGTNVVVSTTSSNATVPVASNNNTTSSPTGITAGFSGSVSAGFSGTPFGSGQAHSKLQPTQIANKIMRVK